jgi:hypothetical protein
MQFQCQSAASESQGPNSIGLYQPRKCVEHIQKTSRTRIQIMRLEPAQMKTCSQMLS